MARLKKVAVQRRPDGTAAKRPIAATRTTGGSGKSKPSAGSSSSSSAPSKQRESEEMNDDEEVPKKQKLSHKSKGKAASGEEGVKKPHRFRPGTVAMREIRRYQRSTDVILKKLPFQRIVREIALDIRPDLRFSANSVEALREASDIFLAQLMKTSYMCTAHRKCLTLGVPDMRLALTVSGQEKFMKPSEAAIAAAEERSDRFLERERIKRANARYMEQVHRRLASQPSGAASSAQSQSPQQSSEAASTTEAASNAPTPSADVVVAPPPQVAVM